MSQISNAAIPADPTKGELIPAAAAPAENALSLFDTQVVYRSNIDSGNPVEAPLLFRATQKADANGDEAGGQEWPTRWYFAHPVEMAVGDGEEIVQAIRLVLIQPDGKTLATVSPHVGKGLLLVLKAFGEGPWDPPLRLRVVKQKSRRGFTFYSLDMIFTPPPPVKGKVK